ncbi:MarR family winged helix-turn-helix transcriptional regulator [Sphingobium subterraneum]|uniref:DNA-binding MarR family transcriptional regulator n=1 Tax=Sphingobium subterraneum TaxID=627688 RepID=A0A841J8S1_9SPHN|nr:MarR family winged helix-turn-helix transcriptional regulator [Sphingobium subterraneum]MBB6124915.1 DNA-binding MarR family transcriptional regulator [Sphingobium subterraneum]
MTVTQFAILRHLDRFGKLPLSRLAEAMVMDRTSLYRALAPLEREGWVIISSAGQRTKVATLSANGKVAMSNATGQWEYAQNAMLTAIGADEWRDLAVALGGIVSASQALPA